MIKKCACVCVCTKRKSNKKIFLHILYEGHAWEKSDICLVFCKPKKVGVFRSRKSSVSHLTSIELVSNGNQIFVHDFSDPNIRVPDIAYISRQLCVHAILILIFATSCFVVVVALYLLLFSYDHDYFRKRTICNKKLESTFFIIIGYN